MLEDEIIHVLMLKESATQNPTKFQGPVEVSCGRCLWRTYLTPLAALKFDLDRN
jgi:hypothetical protein